VRTRMIERRIWTLMMPDVRGEVIGPDARRRAAPDKNCPSQPPLRAYSIREPPARQCSNLANRSTCCAAREATMRDASVNHARAVAARPRILFDPLRDPGRVSVTILPKHRPSGPHQ
jgi:hypothetical protein